MKAIRLSQRRINVLVTGGAGSIGGHLSEAFVRDGHAVRALDCLVDNATLVVEREAVHRAREASETAGEYRLVEGDILDRAAVDEQVGWADVVFH